MYPQKRIPVFQPHSPTRAGGQTSLLDVGFFLRWPLGNSKQNNAVRPCNPELCSICLWLATLGLHASMLPDIMQTGCSEEPAILCPLNPRGACYRMFGNSRSVSSVLSEKKESKGPITHEEHSTPLQTRLRIFTKRALYIEAHTGLLTRA